MSNSPAERHRIAGEAEGPVTPLADPRDAALAQMKSALVGLEKAARRFIQDKATPDLSNVSSSYVLAYEQQRASRLLAALDAAKGAG